VKPLLVSKLDTFLKRFDNFRGGELRSFEVISSSVIILTLSGQDSARGFDWITVKFEFSGVSEAKLLEQNKLSFINMDEGISIIDFDSKFVFAIGQCYNISSIKNSASQVMGSSLKYQEGSF